MMGKLIAGIVVGFVVVMSLILIGTGLYTIDQGERGVILRNGKIVGEADAGFHIKTPLIETVEVLSTREHLAQYEDLWLYSFDQQNATMDVTINYKVNADLVSSIYENYGTRQTMVGTLMSPKIFDAVKNVFGTYTAVRAIQDRTQMGRDVEASIRDAVADPRLIITSVQIKNVDFSDAYEQSVEQRMLAEVEVQKIRQNAEREKVQAEILVIQANAKADARVAQATAEAQAIILQGNAEAEAINARGEALRSNPSIVALVQAERWNGVLPITMVPEATLPFLNIR